MAVGPGGQECARRRDAGPGGSGPVRGTPAGLHSPGEAGGP